MPSIDAERRALLAAVAGLTGFAGCLDGHDDEQTVPLQDSPESPVSTPSAHTVESSTDSEQATPTGQFSLTPIAPDEVDGPVRVLPDDLRTWLRAGATSDRTVREVAESQVYPDVQEYEPIPPLSGFDRVRIDDPVGDASGTYHVDADGGVHYSLVAGVEGADPPDDAEVTPVSDLADPRQELVLAAIGVVEDYDARRVSPETELGSWVRTEFFGSYVSHDGTVYRGYEVQQTDAAFFSTRLWYVVSLSAAETESAPVTLNLADVDEAAQEVIDDLRREQETVEPMRGSVEGTAATALESLAAESSLLLTHDAVFRLTG